MGPIVPVCTPVPGDRAEQIGPVDSPEVVYAILSPRALALKRERAWMLLLTGTKRLAVESEIGHGSINEVEVDLDWALRCARRGDTPFAILVHNHPSGSSWPSWADARLTFEMGSAAARQGVELLDHVILGRGEFFSFHFKQGARV